MNMTGGECSRARPAVPSRQLMEAAAAGPRLRGCWGEQPGREMAIFRVAIITSIHCAISPLRPHIPTRNNVDEDT